MQCLPVEGTNTSTDLLTLLNELISSPDRPPAMISPENKLDMEVEITGGRLFLYLRVLNKGWS